MVQELNSLAAHLFDELEIRFESLETARQNDGAVVAPVSAEDCYVLSSPFRKISECELEKFNQLTALTARLLQVRCKLNARFDAAVKSDLLHSQILDQIHESVITMDLAGFILNWNLGAERLFGYTSAEAIGQNILFLYESEDAEDILLGDHFLENGGREMEVRRRKKNGEVFWASLSLSTLSDEQGNPIAMIGYVSDITQRKCAEEKINHLAYYDALTDFPNRTLFKKLVDTAIQHAIRNESSVSVLFIDLNRFKPINEALGHAIGDQLLKQVAARLKSTLREQDVIARLGSDEFAVAVIDAKRHFDVGHVAQKLLQSFEAIFFVEGHELRLSASIGISMHPKDGQDAEQLLQRADIAMFRAKRLAEKSVGDYAFFDAEMNASIAGRMELEAKLRRAIEKSEFYLLYQPKVDIHTGKVKGAEALIRWARPGEGIISPADFIPVAEETNLIIDIDSWVLDAACQQAKMWQAQGIAPFRIAVNVAAKEFTNDLCVRLKACLDRYALCGDWLELELTESMLMRNADEAIPIMKKLSALGVRLALDDFGTGFSSLSYLKRFPIDSVKIDRSFVQGVPDDIDDCAISSAIISMAKKMRHQVVAEGVENNEQFTFLQQMGCDEIQGYLFAKPLDAEKFQECLLKGFRLPFVM
ncbi:EAL domain-containing protein [Undibacterium cyanobacteriorum]|uniref:EAL domain-containing protein n=1 Tax=Undibacterium cyanobacteriorum TaxID=3073561 RepID=A0ABY9RMQ8_9BURK|nr:EAL domain-containing protein [Undibacterium sp. 20NA77.5]WMW82246.1 EAL domain-containing protein [Undibacterium sp. 20NA77.5]